MIQNVLPGYRSGSIAIPASKSQAHRLLICAALGSNEITIHCDGLSKDILATANCLNSMGAEIRIESESEIHVSPVKDMPTGFIHLLCGESGSTLRFLLPVVGALGLRAIFHREGRLPSRPLTPLDDELRRGGMRIEEDGSFLVCEGQLSAIDYLLPGNVSSQYISGMLMALPKLSGNSSLTVTGSVESAAYIRMTEEALRLFHIRFNKQDHNYMIPGKQVFSGPEALEVEGDWSNAAFFLSLGALSPDGVLVKGLNTCSPQGDRAVVDILKRFGAEVTISSEGIFVRRGVLKGTVIDAAPIPDLIPVLSVVAAAAEGETRVLNAGRLRLKESDRIKSTVDLIRSLGGTAEEQAEGLVIRGTGCLEGGTVDAFGDHRIAMSAAVAGSISRNPVCIPDALCVEKSYPRFWEDFQRLERGPQ